MEEKLKVLFVASGNSSNFDIAPFIKAQGKSLVNLGISISYFSIKGKGLAGYIKSAIELRKHLQQNNIDIIHAHYSLSGWTAVFAFPNQPIVLSLMGSDAYGDFIEVGKISFISNYLKLLTKLIQPFIAKIICKSEYIESFVYQKRKSSVIPNGILLDKFLFNAEGNKAELGLLENVHYVLFLGDKQNIRKNYNLAKEAIDRINIENVKMISPFPVSNTQVVKYLNSVDCLIVPSLMEGSPNVVKEAMACNCPVVATDMGDIKWLFGTEPGYFLTSFDPNDVVIKIKAALDFSQRVGRTKGRERIIELGLDAETVAKKIINVYESVLQ